MLRRWLLLLPGVSKTRDRFFRNRREKLSRSSGSFCELGTPIPMRPATVNPDTYPGFALNLLDSATMLGECSLLIKREQWPNFVVKTSKICRSAAKPCRKVGFVVGGRIGMGVPNSQKDQLDRLSFSRRFRKKRSRVLNTPGSKRKNRCQIWVFFEIFFDRKIYRKNTQIWQRVFLLLPGVLRTRDRFFRNRREKLSRSSWSFCELGTPIPMRSPTVNPKPLPVFVANLQISLDFTTMLGECSLLKRSIYARAWQNRGILLCERYTNVCR